MEHYFWTYDNLKDGISNTMCNVMIESHIVHLRNLAIFFKAKSPYKTDLYCTKFGFAPMVIKLYNHNNYLINKSIFHLDEIRLTKKNLKNKRNTYVKGIYCEMCKRIKVFLENLSGDYLDYKPEFRVYLHERATKAIMQIEQNITGKNVTSNIHSIVEPTFATYSDMKVLRYPTTPEVSIDSSDVQSDSLGPGSDLSDNIVWKSLSEKTDKK